MHCREGAHKTPHVFHHGRACVNKDGGSISNYCTPLRVAALSFVLYQVFYAESLLQSEEMRQFVETMTIQFKSELVNTKYEEQ